VSDIISYQFECYNGEGSNKLLDPQILKGAKILTVARDYWRYTLGQMTKNNMNEIQVKTEVKKFTNTRYDPEIPEILSNTDNIVSDQFFEKQILSGALEPGMVLKYNLFNNTHILLLSEGHVFNKVTIAKLVQFEKSQSKLVSLIVEEHQIET
jgi:hypothetical protein